MAVTNSPRLGLTRWGADGDPFTRAQMDGDHLDLDNLAAIDLQGTFAARPAASIRGRYYYATDVARAFRDTGSAWVEVPIGQLAVANGIATLDSSSRNVQQPALHDATRHQNIDLSGTFAARPAASLRGRTYHATDTGRYFYDTGTAWLETPIGQVAVANGIATLDAATRVVQQPALHDATRHQNIDLEGTFAARPAAATRGRTYRATDTGRFYWDTGAAWVEIPLGALGAASGIATLDASSFVVQQPAAHDATRHTDREAFAFVGLGEVMHDGCTSTALGPAGEQVNIKELANAADQGFLFNFALPDDMAGSVLGVEFEYTVSSGVEGNVRFELGINAPNISADWSAGGGKQAWTEAGVVAATNGINRRGTRTTRQSWTLNVPIARGAGEPLGFHLRRRGGDPLDTYAGIVRILGIRVYYTRDH